MTEESSEKQSSTQAPWSENLNSNQPLSNIRFTGKNYLPWSRAILVALGGKGKDGYITGETRSPSETDKAGRLKWRTTDMSVMSAIFNTMDPKIYEVFAYHNTSKELWDAVKTMYGRVNNSIKIFEIQKHLAETKQETDQSFVEYFGQLTKQWQELRQHRPPAATLDEYLKREEHDKIYHMLANLKPDFEEVRRNILMTSPLPSIDTVCALIEAEETQKRVMTRGFRAVQTSSPVENYAHHTNSKPPGKGKKPRFHCDHCNRGGHTRDRCWVLHPELRLTRTQTAEANMGVQSESYKHQLEQLAKQMEHLMKNIPGSSSMASETNMAKASGNSFALSAFSRSCIIVDSGATDTMFNSKNYLSNIHGSKFSPQITVANGSKIPTDGSGTARIFSKDIDAMIVPDLKANLLSISKCTNAWNCNVTFTPQKVIFQDRDTGKKIGEGQRINGLYVLQMKNSALALTRSNSASSHLWHRRLGHPSDRVLQHLNLSLFFDSNNCDSCRFAKFHRLPFNNSLTKSDEVFGLIHSDLWGPAPVESRDGFKYFVTFIDDKSRTTWVYLLKSKRDVCQTFQIFCNMITNQFKTSVKILRTDNGTEYTNHEFQTYLANMGIMHQTSCVGTPQQNGIAERKNRHLLEVTRALLISAHLPKIFWSDTVLTACYLINRLPSRILDTKSPLHILYNRPINIFHLRVFGSTCYVHAQNSGKLDPRAIKCVFIGYSSLKKGYKCYDPTNKKLFISRDVSFNEELMFFTDQTQGENSTYNEFSILKHTDIGVSIDSATSPADITLEPTQAAQVRPPEPTTVSETGPARPCQTEPCPAGPSSATSGSSTEPTSPTVEPISESSSSQPAGPTETTGHGPYQLPELRKSTRDSHLPARLDDYVLYEAVKYPIQDYVRYNNLSTNFHAFLTKISSSSEPKKFEEAVTNKVWMDAMKDELDALNRNDTWKLVKIPSGKKTVGCRWIYKIKYRSDGTIERHKARLVAKGYTQTYGVDYTETFAPVAKMNTVRTLMSIATNHQWPLFQMDVRNAFLHGELEEEVYMDLPPGLSVPSDSGLCCRLKKSIYGLKQSSRAWYGKLSSALEKVGFQRSQAEPTMFFLHTSQGIVIILIYVDDLVLTGSDLRGIEKLKQHLHREFDIKDLGILKYFLGIEVAQSSKGLFLSQRKYVLDLLNETGKLGAKPASTPMEPNSRVTDNSTPLEDVSTFQRLVGKLIYLTITRPDISFAVSYISQFMQKPMKAHMELINQVLRYLKGAPGRGILMKNHGHTELVCYTDSDWAGNPLDRRSTTGFCTFVGGNPVTWKSKKQQVVARSSAEAEYRAMALATSEIVWLRLLLQELGLGPNSPTKLYCDNQAAIHIASNPVFHERTKHIEVDCHFVREKLKNKIIETPYVRSKDQLADVFTKALPKGTFQEMIYKLTSDILYGST